MLRRRDIAALLANVRRVLAVGFLLAVIWGPWRDTSAGEAVSVAVPPLRSVRMIDVSRGWALTDHDCVLHTEDGGVHWRNVTPVGRSARLHCPAPTI